MKFLNIAVTVRDSEEFIASSHEQIGVWTMLQIVCHDHENYGKISGARLWCDKHWLRLGLPGAEYMAQKSPLWHYVGDDLLVAHYNKSQQNKRHRISNARSKASNKRWDEYRKHKNGSKPE